MSETELYRRYRPRSWKRVVGQPDAVKILHTCLENGKTPHVILLTGPSGTGKTTVARILRRKLGCSDADFVEVNAADDRGIGMVRTIQNRCGLAPMNGKCRVWLVDECHQLTNEAQGAFLKLLEDTPSHVYFMLATTDPQKLKQTIITRATEIRFKSIGPELMEGLLDEIGKREKAELTEDVRDKIVEIADGSARKALVLLHQVIGIEGEDERLEALEKADSKRQTIDLCRMMMKPEGLPWPGVAKQLRLMDDEPETIRRAVIGYLSSVVLKGNHQDSKHLVSIIECFAENYYDTGKAGLVMSCWEAVHPEFA